jgi:hypothetical protein
MSGSHEEMAGISDQRRSTVCYNRDLSALPKALQKNRDFFFEIPRAIADHPASNLMMRE